MRRLSILIIIFTFVLIAGATSAEETSIFGPKKFSRTTGGPNLYINSFRSFFPRYAMLTISSGDKSGTNRVNSAVIEINNIKILGSDIFEQDVVAVETLIFVDKENTISVRLKGKPGSYLIIHIKTKDYGGTIDVKNARGHGRQDPVSKHSF